MANKFRQQFQLDRRILNWFPGHMVAGIKRVNKMLRNIDCIIEIHDARVPFTGRNSKFHKQLSETRPHYLILNKVDLCDQSIKDEVREKIQSEEKIKHVVYTNLRTNFQIKKVLPEVVRIVRKSERYQRTNQAEINLLVTGIPNVGKSSFINQITNLYVKGKGVVARKGSQPGVTIKVQEKVKLSSNPLVYIYDTPGILEPRFDDPVVDPLKLAACDLLSLDRIGIENVADYLLFYLNKYNHFEYVEQLNLDEPIDQIDQFLARVCIKNDLFIKRINISTKKYDLTPDCELAATKFVKLFQKNKLGQFTLDIDKLNIQPSQINSIET